MSLCGGNQLSSVSGSPFIRNYGPLHYMSQQDSKCVPSSVSRLNAYDSRDEVKEQDYHVNSGFVNKIRSKFSLLNCKSEQVSLSRKSASADNLLDIDNHSSTDYLQYGGTGKHSSMDNLQHVGTGNHSSIDILQYGGTGNHSSMDNLQYGGTDDHSSMDNLQYGGTNLASDDSCIVSSKWGLYTPVGYKHRREPSNQDANQNNDKAPFANNNIIRSVKPPLPPKPSVESLAPILRALQSSSKIKTATVHHDWTVAPDVEVIGRENIIILESSNSSKCLNEQLEAPKNTNDSTQANDSTQDTNDEFRVVKPLKQMEEVGDELELPKANTVSAYRTLFEGTCNLKEVSDTSKEEFSRNFINCNSGTIDISSDKIGPFKNSVAVDTKDNSLTRDSFPLEDCTQNLDITSTSLQKSWKLCQNTSEDKGQTAEIERSSKDEQSQNETSKDINIAQQNNIAIVQHRINPVHPMHKVFDSKSIKLTEKVDRPKHLKSQVVVRSHVPKDTIELKHEADWRKSLELENFNSLTISLDTKELKLEADRRSLELGVKNNQNSENESRNITNDIRTRNEIDAEVTVPAAPGKLSRKIFDSRNILKTDRKFPKVPIYQVETVSDAIVNNNVLKKVDIMEDFEISQDEQHKKQIEPDFSDTADMFDISQTKTNININKLKDLNFLKAPSQSIKEMNDSKVLPMVIPVESMGAPVRGMSSFLASMLKKSQPDNENQMAITLDQPANGSSPLPVPRKHCAPERTDAKGSMDIELRDEKSSPPLPSTPVPELSNKNINNVIRRPKRSPQQSTRMVFDSSKIVTKRKEPPKRKSPRKPTNELNHNVLLDNSVPQPDLSSITSEKPETAYQDGYIPTVIGPCPYVFLGAEVIFDKSPYKKSKKVKVTISFDDHATTTFEYNGEELALENYLQKHPEEREEVLEQELESSVSSQKPGALLYDSPHVLPMPESNMKSISMLGLNTAALTSYKSKMQTQEFQFGVQSEPNIKYDHPDLDLELTEPKSIQIRPADDSEMYTFSAEIDKSDMLF